MTWTPEPQFPFFRLTETPQSMPWLAPEGKTLITADIGAEIGDEYWTMDDDELGDRCIDALDRDHPDRPPRLPRVPRRPPADRVPGVPPRLRGRPPAARGRRPASTGSLSIGRNGEFAHILMEDVYWRTMRKRPQARRRAQGRRPPRRVDRLSARLEPVLVATRTETSYGCCFCCGEVAVEALVLEEVRVGLDDAQAGPGRSRARRRSGRTSSAPAACRPCTRTRSSWSPARRTISSVRSSRAHRVDAIRVVDPVDAAGLREARACPTWSDVRAARMRLDVGPDRVRAVDDEVAGLAVRARSRSRSRTPGSGCAARCSCHPRTRRRRAPRSRRTGRPGSRRPSSPNAATRRNSGNITAA